jgi:hypothetical protein
MTFTKINKSCRVRKRFFYSGQAIFEYFILTAVVVAAVLFFSTSQYFKDATNSCEKAFVKSVGEILE